MNYLLDTSLISELVKPTPNKAVLKWVEGHPEQTMFLSVLTLGEIQKGVAKLARSKRKALLQEWVNNDLPRRFSGRVLDITGDVALLWGKLQGEAEMKGLKMPVIDSLIAATGKLHNLIVVTRNGTDIVQSGVEVFNPWP